MRFRFQLLSSVVQMETALFITHETGVGLIIITIRTVQVSDLHALNPWMCLSFTPVHFLTPLVQITQLGSCSFSAFLCCN